MRLHRAAPFSLALVFSPLALAAPCGGFVDVDDANPAHAPFCASFPNRVTDSFGVVGGGFGNRAGNNDADQFDARFATVSGGEFNLASGSHSTVIGGDHNQASGAAAVVLGGVVNTAGGRRATAIGGVSNEASGEYSLAAGKQSKALAEGCFVWADANVHNPDFVCNTPNRFMVRATGGVRLVTAITIGGSATAGVELLAGDSSWNVISDRAAKANWRDVDGRAILDKLASIPIGEWSYRAQSDEIRHIGPNAQDFRAAFGLGHNDLTISTVDADGVALAAIQGLNAKLAARIGAQEREIAELRARLDQLLAHSPPLR